MKFELPPDLGNPDIQLDGLRIWVHGYQYSDVSDYNDGNWIDVTICATFNGAQVWVEGPVIHLPEIAQWAEDADKLYRTLNGDATLLCMENNLFVKMTADKLGHLEVEIYITPNVLTQKHKFVLELDQSYLPGLVTGCKRVLEKYPVRGLLN